MSTGNECCCLGVIDRRVIDSKDLEGVADIDGAVGFGLSIRDGVVELNGAVPIGIRTERPTRGGITSERADRVIGESQCGDGEVVAIAIEVASEELAFRDGDIIIFLCSGEGALFTD